MPFQIDQIFPFGFGLRLWKHLVESGPDPEPEPDMIVLATDDGEPLLTDDEQFVETY